MPQASCDPASTGTLRGARSVKESRKHSSLHSRRPFDCSIEAEAKFRVLAPCREERAWPAAEKPLLIAHCNSSAPRFKAASSCLSADWLPTSLIAFIAARLPGSCCIQMNCAIASAGTRTARPQLTRGSRRLAIHDRTVDTFRFKASAVSATVSRFFIDSSVAHDVIRRAFINRDHTT